MTPVEIHGFAPSTFVRTARMAAAEKGIPHTLVPLAFHSPEHYALHPFGKMPVLRHNGLTLTETAAICVYLDEAFSGPRLQPGDALARAQMWRDISAASDYAYSALVTAALGDEPPDQAATARVLDALEEEANKAEHADEDSITLGDLFLAPIIDFHVRSGGGKAALDNRPGLRRWFARMSVRESFKETQPQ